MDSYISVVSFINESTRRETRGFMQWKTRHLVWCFNKTNKHLSPHVIEHTKKTSSPVWVRHKNCPWKHNCNFSINISFTRDKYAYISNWSEGFFYLYSIPCHLWIMFCINLVLSVVVIWNDICSWYSDKYLTWI